MRRLPSRKDPSFSIRKLDYDDAATYKMLGQGETEGVFQLESSGMKHVLVGLQPQNLEDVIALISLYRPGPMDSIPTYLRNRHEPDKISYKTPQLAHILDVTNGCIVYQEQVMQIFRELAGFSFGQADNVRRAMSKKKHAVMEAEREHFVHGCTEPGHECRAVSPMASPRKLPTKFTMKCQVLRPTPSIKPCGLLRLRRIPDGLSQVSLPQRVYGRIAHQCA